MKLSALINKATDLEKEMRRLQLLIANSILIESREHLVTDLVDEYQEVYRKYNKLLDTDVRKTK